MLGAWEVVIDEDRLGRVWVIPCWDSARKLQHGRPIAFYCTFPRVITTRLGDSAAEGD